MSIPFHHLAEGISCHAWNKDKSMLALCPNNSEIWIYSNCTNTDSTKWKKECVLTEHDMLVSGIDWSPVHNMIVSCSHDRNAFVWKFSEKEKEWKPSLVLLRVNRAATNVKWSPDGKKFAVSSGAKCVPVCYYEASNNWWISKMIKKHKSTVIDIDWHPNSQLLLTGSSDMKCRVFSAYVSDLDGAPQPGPFQNLSPFGDVMAEFDHSRGWVEGVAWSVSGNRLAFAGHDSSIHFVSFTSQGSTPTIQSLRFPFLPLERVMFVSESAVVGAGHDFNVLLFTCDASNIWSFYDTLQKKPTSTETKTASGGFSAARSMWESKVSRGQSADATYSDKGALWTKHESTITYLKPYETSGNGSVTNFTSSALDGRLVFWKLSSLCNDLSNLRL